MSALVPTTPNSLGARFPTGVDEIIFDFLGERELHSLAQVSKASRLEVHAHYRDQYQNCPDLLDEYRGGDLKKRSVELIRQTRRLYGGKRVLDQARKFGGVSPFHPTSQLWLAEARWNCKVIGLLPFLEGIPAARGMLREVSLIGPNKMKFQKMREWIKSHPDEVSSVRQKCVRGYKTKDVARFAYPLFADVGPKVYNFLPSDVARFSQLEDLNLDDNRLSELPKHWPRNLKTLSLKNNMLRSMPPGIPTLRSVCLNGNVYAFSAEDVTRFITQYIENGGQGVKIFLDDELGNLNGEWSSHEVTIERHENETVVSISKILEPTQKLTQPSELP